MTDALVRAGPQVERLGLGCVLALCLCGCESSAEFLVDVVLPAEHGDLEAADNAFVRTVPDGFEASFAVDGVDFALEIELEPDSEPRELELFLANGETLLAWGRTPPFAINGAGAGISVFLGRPGTLSTFPTIVDAPHAQTLAAPAAGRGMVVLEPDGDTFFFNEFSMGGVAGEPLTDPPDAADGTLVGDALGGVMRLTWNESITARRFDPGTDEWIDVALGGDDAGPRAGAAHLVDATAEHVLLFGGGDATDAVVIDLLPDEDGKLAVERRDDVSLDGPRVGARASWLTRRDTDDGETVVVFGTDDPTLPVGYSTAHGVGLGPDGATWTAGRCAQIDVGEGSEASDEVRILCAGGLRDGTATADAVLLRFPPAGGDGPTAEEQPGFLPAQMADPLWLADEGAVYAQGAGRLFRVDREDLSVSEPTGAPQRESGGQSVTLATGATFLLGGVGIDGGAVDRWQVFVPALPPTQ